MSMSIVQIFNIIWLSPFSLEAYSFNFKENFLIFSIVQMTRSDVDSVLFHINSIILVFVFQLWTNQNFMPDSPRPTVLGFIFTLFMLSNLCLCCNYGWLDDLV